MKLRKALKVMNKPWKYHRLQVEAAFNRYWKHRGGVTMGSFVWWIAYDRHYRKMKAAAVG